MDRDRGQPGEPTLLASIWRFRWLSLLIVTLAVAAGLAYTFTRPTMYVATASLVVEDPRASTLFGSLSSVSPTRYLAEQISTMYSSSVAQKAAEIAVASGASGITADEIAEGIRITASGDSNFVQITFEASDAGRAVAGVNALADAYQDVQRSEALRSAALALNELDGKIIAITVDLVEIRSRIDELRSTGSELGLAQTYDAARRRLGELYTLLAGGNLGEEQRLELDDIVAQLNTLRLLSTIDSDSPEISALLQEQRSAIDRRSDLESRRDEIEVDAALSSSTVSLFSPALDAVETGGDLSRSLVVSVALGGLAGVLIPFLLSSRKRGLAARVARMEPEAVLAAPLLAEISDFKDEGIKSGLPVRDVPRSLAAEGFRFAVTGLEFQMSSLFAGQRSRGPSRPLKSVVVCSAAVSDGKTTVCANVAWAAAKRGSRVLAIDADFSDQQLTRSLNVDPVGRPGLTDIVENDIHLTQVVHTVEVAAGVHLDLLSRGGVDINAPEFFRSAETQTLFETIRNEYDLVIIDSPPILQVAYSSLIARYADAALVVVNHGSGRVPLEDIRDRLDLVGTPIIGYVYNRAPIRREMAMSEGSMKDVLGPP